MIVQMLSAIPESEEKWFLKLKIQQEIIHLGSRANQHQYLKLLFLLQHLFLYFFIYSFSKTGYT